MHIRHTNSPPELRHDAFGVGKSGHHGPSLGGFAGHGRATGDTWGVALGVLTMGGLMGALMQGGAPPKRDVNVGQCWCPIRF